MKLLCYCDHCKNNTCTTHEYGLCWAELRLDQDGGLEKRFNCFNQDIRPVQELICNSNTHSHIVRCCENENLCNQKADFLPVDDEARKIFSNQRSQPSYDGNNDTLSYPKILQNSVPNSSSQASHRFLPVTEPGYPNIRIEFLIVFLMLSAVALTLVIAIAQHCLAARKRRGRRQLLATIPNDDSQDRTGLNGTTGGDNDGNNTARRNGTTTGGRLVVVTDEDHSENSSCKANQDAIVYDTNSMASREPLINHAFANSSTTPVGGPGGNNVTNSMYANSLQHPNPLRGPWMQPVDDSVTGKTTSCTFQMSIGSGDPQKKPETSSGSGQGQPYLTQRSIAHDIELKEVVGRGYFGVVWRGEYKSEPVAVKIFSQKAEPSWQREAEIYQTTMLRHKNILGFIATDKRADVSMTGYWLVTDFYPMGSLFDFLKKQSISMTDALRMAFSIANGLAHLHVEIFGTHGKPAIAHRDLKSKNVLVKNDGTCCLADLGMAVRYNSNTGVVDVPTNTRVGTRRYLAPEILEEKLNLMDFEAVKATDIYALGLVLWEILRRTCYLDPSSTRGSSRSKTNGQTKVLSHQQDKSSSTQSSSQRHKELSALSTSTAPNINTIINLAQELSNTTYENTTDADQQEQQLQPLISSPPHSVSSSRKTSQSSPPPSGESELSGRLSPVGSENSINESKQPLITQNKAIETTGQQNNQIQKSLLEASIEGGVTATDSNSQRIKQSCETTSANNFIESIETSIDDLNSELASVCDPYEAPYQEFVQGDPTTEEMYKIVCEQKIRPPLSVRWTKFAPMRDYTALMRECWYEKPQARLSALRIRKTLGDIARHYFNLNMEYD